MELIAARDVLATSFVSATGGSEYRRLGLWALLTAESIDTSRVAVQAARVAALRTRVRRSSSA
jgi:hypothetical protein